MPVVERMTAEEYLARPYDPRERVWELIGGALVGMNDPLLPHQLVCGEIAYALELARGDTLTSPLLPGCALAVETIFGA